jgi:hypothetical protein
LEEGTAQADRLATKSALATGKSSTQVNFNYDRGLSKVLEMIHNFACVLSRGYPACNIGLMGVRMFAVSRLNCFVLYTFLGEFE